MIDFLNRLKIPYSYDKLKIVVNLVKEPGLDTYHNTVQHIFEKYGIKFTYNIIETEFYKTKTLEEILSEPVSDIVQGDYTIILKVLGLRKLEKMRGMTKRYGYNYAKSICNFYKCDEMKKVLLQVHELGHAFGAHHNFTNYATMNPDTFYKSLFIDVDDIFFTKGTLDYFEKRLLLASFNICENNLKVNNNVVSKAYYQHINTLRFTSNNTIQYLINLNTQKIETTTTLEKLYGKIENVWYIAYTNKGYTNPVCIEVVN